jgi:putative PIN family toxin of toxin-antitoxin system
MIPKATQPALQRIVIDTNVCLDLFIFRDPRWQALMDGIKSGEMEAVTSASCRMEFMLVLAYEKMQLSTESQAAILQEFDQLIQLVEIPTMTSATHVIKLPVCKDRDDQKFLELAYASQADALITKDKALLKLARKTIRSQLFRIFSPEAWLASYVPKLDLSK